MIVLFFFQYLIVYLLTHLNIQVIKQLNIKTSHLFTRTHGIKTRSYTNTYI